ncbi:MAG: hypothetical protein Q3972_02120 [Corynebacterium sp.]|nr:hypothetical protein [Corynebacterium sp.]
MSSLLAGGLMVAAPAQPEASARSSDAGYPAAILYNFVFIPNYLIWILSPFVMYNVLVDLGIVQSIRVSNAKALGLEPTA